MLLAAAEAQLEVGNTELAWRFGRRAVACAPDHWMSAPERMMYEVWPVRPGRKARAGRVTKMDTVGITAACGLALWRLLSPLRDERGFQLDAGDVGGNLAFAGVVRDALLERLSIPRGPASDRMVQLAAKALKVADVGYGCPDLRRWNALLAADVIAERQVRRYACYHAAALHSRMTLLRVLWGSGDAPVSLRGTVFPQLAKCVHLMLLRTGDRDVSSAEAMATLDEARRVVPLIGPIGQALIPTLNEGRYVLGARSQELLDDLLREDGLAAATEALRVADELGDPNGVTRALRRLKSVAAGTEHAWAVSCIRALRQGAGVDRLGELAERGAVERAGDRLSRALYGGSAEAGAFRLREAVVGEIARRQEASALRQERIEEVLTAPPRKSRERPGVPALGDPDGAHEAFSALRWRLERQTAWPRQRRPRTQRRR